MVLKISPDVYKTSVLQFILNTNKKRVTRQRGIEPLSYLFKR
jgi:hypothetical protein